MVPHGTLGEAEAGDEGRTVSPPVGLPTLQSLPVNWEGGGYPGPGARNPPPPAQVSLSTSLTLGSWWRGPA